MRYIEIQQVRSATRRHGRQRQTLIGLGLNRIGRVKWVPDTPQVRGMIKKVLHLVRINNDPAAPGLEALAPVYDEAQDAALMRELAFDPNGIALEAYSDAELKAGKRPDFKLLKDGNLVAFCEFKSPRDDFVFEAPGRDGFAIRKNLPFYRKLGSHIRRAAEQLETVNPDHKLPNIMVFVNHAPDIARRDLLATIAGLPVPGGWPLFMLSPKMQAQVTEAARHIDLFLWIDAEKGTCQHLSVSGAAHETAALELLGLRKEADA